MQLPGDNLNAVIHPQIAFDLKSGLTNTFANPNANGVGNEALRSGFVGQIAGVNIFETSNMTDSSGNDPGTTGDYKGAVFHRDALALADDARSKNRNSKRCFSKSRRDCCNSSIWCCRIKRH